MLQINVTSWMVERSRTLIGLLCSIQDDSASLTSVLITSPQDMLLCATKTDPSMYERDDHVGSSGWIIVCKADCTVRELDCWEKVTALSAADTVQQRPRTPRLNAAATQRRVPIRLVMKRRRINEDITRWVCFLLCLSPLSF